MEYCYSRPMISMVLLLPILGLASAGSYVIPEAGDEDNNYWANRENEAKKMSQHFYVPDPFAVTSSFNAAVHRSMERKNTTRRSLGSTMRSSCKATNPIDRCWRCRADWADDRQRLAGCSKGFGRKAYGGGRKGEIYVVTDPRDDYPGQLQSPRPGTLRYGVIQNRPIWIIFAEDMNITLQQELMITSHTTIDGRGAVVHIQYGGGLTIQAVSNVIVHCLHIHDIVNKRGGFIRDTTEHVGFRTRSDGDAISIFTASNIWIDHVSLARCDDGLIDMIEMSTAITVSNSYFSEHNDVMLLGAHDDLPSDWVMQVTLAFNHFGVGCIERMPRARFGFVHIVNNDYTEWSMYAIGGSMHPTLISQGNRYRADLANPNAREITKRHNKQERIWKHWNWTSEGDIYENGAFFVPSGVLSSNQLTSNFSRYDVFKAKPGSYVSRLTRYAGALHCYIGVPC